MKRTFNVIGADLTLENTIPNSSTLHALTSIVYAPRVAARSKPAL